MQRFWQRKTEHSHECAQNTQIRNSGYPTYYTPNPTKSTKKSHDQSKKPLGLKTLQADGISTAPERSAGGIRQRKAPQRRRAPTPGSSRSAEVGPAQRRSCCRQISPAIYGYRHCAPIGHVFCNIYFSYICL